MPTFMMMDLAERKEVAVCSWKTQTQILALLLINKFLYLPSLSLPICKRIIKIASSEILMYKYISKL